MIEYLEKLVEEKQYEKALAYAEQLLLNPDNSAWEMMAIYSALCEVRCETGEFYGAQVAGQLAVKMARDLEAWDYFGKASGWLGLCYDRLRQPENALSAWYEYLAYVPFYSKALKHHVTVLYNIGIVQAQAGRHQESLRTLQQAADVANAVRDHRKAHGIRHAMIDAHLRYGQIEQIPALLAKCAHFLRHNPKTPTHTQSLLWHLVLRVRYALATHRPRRALRVAQRGIRLEKTLPETSEMVYHLHRLSALAYEQLNNLRSCLEEGVRARAVAIEFRRYDLEFEITDYIYGLISSHPDLSEQFGTLHHGICDPSTVG